MNAPVSRASPLWRDYLLALLFAAPSVAAFWMVAIFIAPKLQQMCADVGYDGTPFFVATSLVGRHGWKICAVLVLASGFAEMCAPFWRKHRQAFLAGAVFLVNTAVLVNLVSSLVLSGIVGPALGAKAGQTASARK